MTATTMVRVMAKGKKGVFFLSDEALETYIEEIKREALTELCSHLSGVDNSHRVPIKEVIRAIEDYRDSI